MNIKKMIQSIQDCHEQYSSKERLSSRNLMPGTFEGEMELGD
jgi:hypothetical protein